jgi:hypothetical protein
VLTIGIFFVLCVFLIDLSDRYKRVKLSHKKMLTSTKDHVFYVHTSDEQSVIRTKKKARLIALSGLVLSIAYAGNMVLIVGYLNHQIISMLSALFLLVLIVCSFFSYQATTNRQLFTKEIDYHKAIKGLGNCAFAGYLVMSLVSLLVFAVLMNYRRDVFAIDMWMSVIASVALINAIVAYVLYASYHRFIGDYRLFAVNGYGKKKELK